MALTQQPLPVPNHTLTIFPPLLTRFFVVIIELNKIQ